MKKLVVFAVLAAIVASCADDNPPQIEKSSELVSPRLLMDVSTESGQSPLTGILTIMPCKAGTSIYYGNYINRKLTPFCKRLSKYIFYSSFSLLTFATKK